MAAQNEPATGTDFWAAIGVAQETEDEPVVNGSAAPAAAEDTASAASETMAGQPEKQDDWAALFSTWDDSANGPPPASRQPATGTSAGRTGTETAAAQAPASVPFKTPKTPKKAPTRTSEKPQDASAGQAGQNTQAPQDTQAPRTAQAPAAPAPRTAPSAQAGQATQSAAPTQAPQPAPAQPAQEPADEGASQTQAAADPAWITAERIANSLRPRLPEIWLDVLTRHTNGDAAMASKVYNVLNGSHLLGELLRDENIDEVHVHGTQVTVCGVHGIRQIPGFPSLTASRRAIKTIAASREKTGAVITKVNDFVVISRRNGLGPNTNALTASGVVTAEQVAQIRQTLEQMQAVTVAGPAARIVVRALASLIPEGSRVFLGAYATLPAGCVTAVSPMEADYVLGVRPGAVAEEMAAAGQVGALIANPETRLPTALRFAVTGQSAAPEKLISR